MIEIELAILKVGVAIRRNLILIAWQDIILLIVENKNRHHLGNSFITHKACFTDNQTSGKPANQVTLHLSKILYLHLELVVQVTTVPKWPTAWETISLV